MYIHYLLVGKFLKINAFWDVLPYKLVGVLNQAFLPRRVWVGEKDLYPKLLGDYVVPGELGAVVGGDGQDALALVRHQHSRHLVGQRLGILPVLELDDYHVSAEALNEGEYRAVSVLSDDQVHLPVPEARPVRLGWPVMDGAAVLYVLGRGFLVRVPLSVLPPVAQLRPEISSGLLVLVHPSVNGCVRDFLALQFECAGNLLRRPLLVAEQRQGLELHLWRYGRVLGNALFLLVAPLLRGLAAVAAALGGVSLYLSADCRRRHAQVLGYGFFIHTCFEKGRNFVPLLRS